ncbi:hypothetical protein SAMN05428989_3621 [Pseudoxanthomonas sp. GM95]|nr:hypothetical protein SAMN05428989_3621 [Pseudoxanthomonas sp. GM95]
MGRLNGCAKVANNKSYRPSDDQHGWRNTLYGVGRYPMSEIRYILMSERR